VSEKGLLKLGFSPCPNDTFIFFALATGKISFPYSLDLVIEDVETLNQKALAKELEVSKLSFGVFGHVIDYYELLPVGAALGFGCGPLLVARRELDLSQARVAVPGFYTTAYLLLRLYAPELKEVISMRYDRIMPAVARGEVEAGLIIHEGRFVYQKYGLKKMVDLGAWWEEETKAPIPLGGIFVRREQAQEIKASLVLAIRKSLQYAKGNFSEALPYIKAYAQEMSEEVIKRHIKTYVNQFTEDLGEQGLQAVFLLLEQASRKGLIPGFREDFYFDWQEAR